MPFSRSYFAGQDEFFSSFSYVVNFSFLGHSNKYYVYLLSSLSGRQFETTKGLEFLDYSV